MTFCLLMDAFLIQECLSRDSLSSPLFALVTYSHVKTGFTYLFNRRQTTSCLDSKQRTTVPNYFEIQEELYKLRPWQAQFMTILSFDLQST